MFMIILGVSTTGSILYQAKQRRHEDLDNYDKV
jgi:hypothetical protein